MKKIVYRTCVGCKKVDAKKNMIRLIVKDQELIIDQKKRLGQRGASLHPLAKCLNFAIKSRAFHRAFKYSGALNTSQVQANLTGEVPLISSNNQNLTEKTQ